MVDEMANLRCVLWYQQRCGDRRECANVGRRRWTVSRIRCDATGIGAGGLQRLDQTESGYARRVRADNQVPEPERTMRHASRGREVDGRRRRCQQRDQIGESPPPVRREILVGRDAFEKGMNEIRRVTIQTAVDGSRD